MVTEWQVGQLYLGEFRNGLKVWSQPVPGGTVFPQAPSQFPQAFEGYQQVPMSYPSLYTWGCGHQTNTAEIFEVFQPSLDDQAALITCPVCSFVQTIMLYSQYQNYIDTPLVVG